MNTFYSPDGNPEIWDECPDGYLTLSEWAALHPPPVPDPPSLGEAKTAKRAAIDAQTSAAITAGFDHRVGGDVLHFSYTLIDQQNFTDTAVAASAGFGSTVRWNGWVLAGDGTRTLKVLDLDAPAFLDLYGAALAHKTTCMAQGTNRKAALDAATTLDQVEAI